MAPRRALLIDQDREFVALVAEALRPYGFETTIAEEGPDAVGRIGEIKPELCLIGVELPDKGGFALCNAARRKTKTRSLPIILATRSVPWREMTLHQKVQTHASSYIDKRKTDRAGLLRVVGRLIELGPALSPSDEDAPSEPARTSADAADDDVDQILASIADDEPDERVIPEMDAETRALLASIDEEGPPPSAALDPSPPRGTSSEVDLSDLERENQSLRRELEEAQRVARGSPFSSDFLGLKEEARNQTRQITKLQEAVHARDSRLARAEIRVRRMAKRVLASEKERTLAATEREESRARVERIETELALVQSELDESRIQLAEVWQVRDTALAEKRQLQEASQHLREEIEGLRKAHSLALEQARAQAQAAAQELDKRKAQLGESTKAHAALTKELAAREVDVRQARERIGALEQTHVRELERLRAEAEATAANLEAQQAQAHSLRETIAQLTTQVAEVGHQLDRERRKAEADQRLHDSQVQSVTRQLSSKIASLTEQLEKARARVAELERGVEEQRIMGAGTEQDRRRLQAQLDLLRKELGQERSGREEDGRRAVAQMAEATQRLDAAHVSLSEIQAALEQERGAREADGRLHQIREAEATQRLSDAQVQIEKLQAALDQERRGRQEDGLTAAARLTEAAQRLEVTRARLNDLHATLNDERRAHAEARSQIEKDVRAKLAQAEEAHRKEREAALQEASEQAERKMQELRGRYDAEAAAIRVAASQAEESLKTAFHDAKTEASLARGQARREESVRRRLEEELHEVEARYVAAAKQAEDEHLQSIVKLETELQARHEELARDRAAHESALAARETQHRDAAEDLARRLSAAESERKRLDARAEELDRRLRAAEAAREDDGDRAERARKDERSQHETALRALREEVGRNEAAAREARNELDRLRADTATEIEDLRGQLREANSAHADTRKELDEARAHAGEELEEVRSQLQEAGNARAATQKQLDEAHGRVRALEDKIEAASRERLAAMRDLTRKYEDEIAALTGADANKAAALRLATADATAAVTRADQLAAELAEAKQEIARRKQDLLDLQRTVDSLRAVVGDFSGSRSDNEPARLPSDNDD